MSRHHTDICPRCKIRKKTPNHMGYCTECAKEIMRLRRSGIRKCPICGRTPAPHKHYCDECGKLPERERQRRAQEAEANRAAAERKWDRVREFGELCRDAAKINWRHLWGSGTIGRQSEPKPKKKLELSDFIDPRAGTIF